MIRIVESNMEFVFEEDCIYQIENSALHNEVGEHVKTVELIVSLSEDQLDFVEAKSSTPNPANEEAFQQFIQEICDKFVHSFDMFLRFKMKRSRVNDIPDKLKNLPTDQARFKFILVIHGHKLEWLPPLKDEFEKRLLYHQKIWGTSIIVLNEQLAKQYKYIVK